MGANEPVEGLRRPEGGIADPARGWSRGRFEDVEDDDHGPSARVTPAGRDDERDAAGCGERSRCAVDENAAPEELRLDGVSRRGRDLVDHHRDRPSPPQHRSRSPERADRVGKENAPRGPCLLPETVDPGGMEVLGHDEELGVPGDAARGQVPVPGVRGGDDDAAPARPRRAPSDVRGRLEHRTVHRVGPAGRAQELPHAEAPRARYIARASRFGSAIPAARIAPSTCDRRMRRTLPASQPTTAPSAPIARHGSAPASRASARRNAFIRAWPRRPPPTPAQNPARRTTRPAAGSDSRAAANTSERTTTKISRFGVRACTRSPSCRSDSIRETVMLAPSCAM